MRTNTSGPTGSSTWTKTPTFDQAGYDAALAAYNPGSQGTWIPGGTQTINPGDAEQIITTPGHWEGAVAPSGNAPSRDDFTNYEWTLTNTLSPEQQALYESNVKNQGDRLGVANKATGQLDSLLNGLGGDLGGVNPEFSDAVYRMNTRYLDPQMEQQRARLTAELADSGFVPGTPGYDRAMSNFMDTSNRAYSQARDTATTQGFSQQQQTASLLSNLSGGGAYNLPAFAGGGTSATPNLGSADIMGALNNQYQGQLGQYGANVSSNNATMSAIVGLLSTFLTGSDARLKEDIQTEGFLPSGLRKVSFRYRGGRTRFLGVLAQEAREFFPEAVYLMPDGFYSVDYSRIR